MVKNFGAFVAIVALIGGTNCLADVFPDIPKKTLPTITALPDHGEIILDVRWTVSSGAPVQGYIDSNDVQVGVFDLGERTESIWNLPHDIPMVIPLQCNSCTMRASWASKQRRLLLATKDAAYLIDEAGRYQKLSLRMPGIAVPYLEADEFEIGDDAQLVTFKVFTRDSGDKFTDADDPYTARLGRLYSGLMYEETEGSPPITITKSDIHIDRNGKASGRYVSLPSWSPDRKRFAYEITDDESNTSTIVIAEATQNSITATKTVNLPAGPGHPTVEELRWSPDGKKLGFIVTDALSHESAKHRTSRLMMVDANGSNLRAVRFGNRDINVDAFAWSPAGDRFALRSDYQATTICNHSLSFRLQAGFWPCRFSEHLFTSNVDGSELQRVSKEPEFRRSELLWIR